MNKPRVVPMYINGSWCAASDGRSYGLVDPATGQTFAEAPIATAGDIDRALQASQQGFQTWRHTDPWTRSRLLREAGRLIDERRDEIAALLTEEQGKPLRESTAELKGTAEQFDWFADEARRITTTLVPTSDPHHTATVRREPIGPVAAFSPWNFPALLPTRKIAPALAAGCSLILKPADETPQTALALAQACHDAGMPPGVFNVVTGDAPSISEQLLTSPIIRKITLTGSVPVGRHLLQLAAHNVVDATMELGGHAPVVVLQGVDPAAAATACAAAKFRNAGQVCISPTRFYVHADDYATFGDAFVAVAKGLRLGAGADPDTDVGPLSNGRRLEALDDLVIDAVAAGAILATGGARVTSQQGFFYEPTVLLDVPETARAMSEEPFGPLALLAPYTDLDDAVARANGTSFGLAAYVLSPDSDTGRVLGRRLDAGMVGINHFALSYAGVPFGGVKASGIGTESGSGALDTFLVHKSLHTEADPFA
jgi:succinate-semialdehyde dehydrogenase/glutarate-semialdehyde dehydrogenase